MKQKPKDIVIGAEHTGAESGSSNTKHDGRKNNRKTNRLMVTVQHKEA